MIRIATMTTVRRGAQVALVGACVLFTTSAVAQGTCTDPKTRCGSADGYYAPGEDIARVNAVIEPVMREIRQCLDAAGGKQVAPSVTVRWNSDGKAVSVKFDAPGYETQPCIVRATQKLSTLQNPHETAIRCDHGCAPPPPSTPPALPVAPPPITPIPPPTGAAVIQPTPAPAPVPAAPVVLTEREWYGWASLLVDAAALGIFIGGWAADDGKIVGAGYLGYIFGSPVVHFAHGNVGKGFGAFGMRVGIPLGGFLVGGLFGYGFGGGADGDGKFKNLGSSSNGPVVGATIGGAIGVIAASAIDAGLMAYTKPRPRETASTVTLVPKLDLRPGHTAVGVGGTF